ncbi:Aspartate carbamoyltransferase catalytic chain [Marinomonas spartinae]|uniref:Aspartate carbamoyltransferase n=1 Tax=Marinomonas spartinae TaxID=1792290 RepID=A0A1A8TV09_9GAMM|nr:aspartate carbamoyltransferase [Marinomonas spartinae]SBS37110.1 Aspartate carbamoyltransferase catalytic chain [Marinomonas spartinae]
MLTGKHILSCDCIDNDDLHRLFELADLLQPVAKGLKYTRILEGAMLCSLFFEPSTRTRLSFDSAFMRLGGSVSSTTGFSFSSIAKGESLEDTSRVVSGYGDILVVRHPEEQAIYDIAAQTYVPVINGGNGAGEHPTQALLDLYTLERELQRTDRCLQKSVIVLAGDLRFGRTIHSLVKLLVRFSPRKLIFLSPENLRLPENLRDMLAKQTIDVEETQNVGEALRQADVIYTTRVQKERFPENELAENYSSNFRIDAALFERFASPNTLIMHPLPRDSREGANDLSDDLNSDSRLAIFRQTDAGVPIRMALFASVMGVADHVQNSLQEAKWFTPRYTGVQDAAFYERNPAK